MCKTLQQDIKCNDNVKENEIQLIGCLSNDFIPEEQKFRMVKFD